MKRRTFLKSIAIGCGAGLSLLWKTALSKSFPHFTQPEELEDWLYNKANEIVGKIGADSLTRCSPTGETFDIEYGFYFKNLNNEQFLNNWIKFIEGKKAEEEFRIVYFPKSMNLISDDPVLYWRIKPEIKKVDRYIIWEKWDKKDQNFVTDRIEPNPAYEKNKYSLYTRFLISKKPAKR